jgi:hypothetical protein
LTQVCASAVTIAELFAELRTTLRINWQNVIDELTHRDATREIARPVGVFRYDLARHGRTILTANALFSVKAPMVGATLVTTTSRMSRCQTWDYYSSVREPPAVSISRWSRRMED